MFAEMSSTRVSLTTIPRFPFRKIQGCHRSHLGRQCLNFSDRSGGLCIFRTTHSIVSCSMNMAAAESDDPRKMNLDRAMGGARTVWESFPEPVKTFPWAKVAVDFLQLLADLVFAVIKYLSVPVLVITSLSEMSYSAKERKMALIPIPMVAGILVAGVFSGTFLELSPTLKEARFPYHLVAIGLFFLLLKLPGPYYPYWGRILIPHFANGGLLRTLWLAFQWQRRVQTV
ncbi:hypothetical protein MKW94_008014 [Papaver nudicaule]|uniref:Uncharacterized protein n=1 Tax=Papaver nudicaule TaxID=74823 RepID=A0AA41VSQ5_PAPNU|nr:hypothetical protein [Papaver nudicaule]